MKTYSGEPEQAPPQPLTAGCCGGVTDRVGMVRKVTEATAYAHEMLAIYYDAFVEDVGPEEKEAFVKAAANQRRLAQESREVTIPDGVDP